MAQSKRKASRQRTKAETPPMRYIVNIDYKPGTPAEIERWKALWRRLLQPVSSVQEQTAKAG